MFYLGNSLRNSQNNTYDDFKRSFIKTLDIFAPVKTKYVRGNNAPFMNKVLTKAFMTRAQLKNKYNKDPTGENKRNYNRQRNFCTSLLKKEKRKYYNNLDTKILGDNRKFWERIKPIFTDNQKTRPNGITMIENDSIITDPENL